jgi:hypothetical protein
MAPMMGVAAPQKPSRGGVTTLVAGLLALVVAGLAVGGSFGDVTRYRNSYAGDGDPSVYATRATWWGYDNDGSTSPVEAEDVLSGLTLVLAGVLLVVGAVFAFVGARSRRSGPVSGARSAISAGVGVLAGASLLELFSVLEQMDRYNKQELDAGQSLEFSAGLGLWLPLGGVVVGIVAVVLAHLGRGGADARVEPNTPRMGFPAPYGYRPQMPMQQQQHAPAASERPTDVTVDDSAITQRVNAETASGGTPSAPSSTEAPAAPAEPLGTTATSGPVAQSAEAPAAPAQPASGSPVTGPGAQSAAEAPAAPTSAAPASVTPASPAATPPAPPAPVTGEELSPLQDLPAAPPAPEPSSSDEQEKNR